MIGANGGKMRGSAVGRIIVVWRRRYFSLSIHRKFDYSPICYAGVVGRGVVRRERTRYVWYWRLWVSPPTFQKAVRMQMLQAKGRKGGLIRGLVQSNRLAPTRMGVCQNPKFEKDFQFCAILSKNVSGRTLGISKHSHLVPTKLSSTLTGGLRAFLSCPTSTYGKKN